VETDATTDRVAVCSFQHTYRISALRSLAGTSVVLASKYMTDATADKSAKTDETTPTLVDQLDDPEAGHGPLGVSARCVNCKIVRAKRIADQDPDDTSSFKHVCHNCQRTTWWNLIRVLNDGRGSDHE